MSKEKQDIKLEKVDDKTAYENLLVEYAELENQIADIKANCDFAIEGRDVKIMELEEKISILLSCKKCPENKGGYICKKEYDNKCLAQKIQHIKELQEENANLEQQIEKMKCCENCAYRTVDLLTFKPFCDKRKLEIENPLTCKCGKWKLVN